MSLPRLHSCALCLTCSHECPGVLLMRDEQARLCLHFVEQMEPGVESEQLRAWWAEKRAPSWSAWCRPKGAVVAEATRGCHPAWALSGGLGGLY